MVFIAMKVELLTKTAFARLEDDLNLSIDPICYKETT